jgi:7,8-dihydropterin-6-yl-methyl-4-(beta-D-ribofuranosyl)aminobenzene 5'-phosphate synthase
MGNDIRITVLIDNKTSRADLNAEHGLSLWIEYREKRILFDTGQSSILTQNAKKLGIDLIGTDVIVLSHGHYDHTGGLPAVLDIATKAKIYLHPAATEPKFSQKPPGVKSIGMSDSVKKAIQGRHIIWTVTPAQLFLGMAVTGQVPRINNCEDVGGAFFLDETCQKADELLDDQTLFIESTRGLIIVFGCAHSGVINTLDYICKLTGKNKIYAVIGGMHLVNAGKDRMERTIEAFKRYDIEKIIPLHCTGSEAIEYLRESFSDKCVCCHNNPDICF